MEFPQTTWGMVLAARDANVAGRHRDLERLIDDYWRPIYAYVRGHWRASPEDAQDAVQTFFTQLLERPVLAPVAPERGRFRTFLRTVIDHHMADARRAAGRQKRGGEWRRVALDWEEAERSLGRRSLWDTGGLDPFDREWVRAMLEDAVADLKKTLVASGKERHLEVFLRYDVAGETSYAAVGEALGLSVTEVGNALHAVRAQLRQRIRRKLLDSVQDPADVDDELRLLFGGTR